jgi:glutathione S-transferase
MELYYAPLACSLATRIALYEAGAPAAFIEVDTRAKLVADGSDFRAINAMGQVPVLRTDDGELLTENPAVLQYVADRYPESHLAPSGGMPRYRLQQWLNFITSELHKVVFIPLLDPRSGDGAKAFARDKATERLAFLNAQLDGREYLLDRFTVADAYLVTVLNWARFSGVDLSQFMAVDGYFNRLRERPSIARALAEELVLYQEQQVRRAA